MDEVVIHEKSTKEKRNQQSFFSRTGALSSKFFLNNKFDSRLVVNEGHSRHCPRHAHTLMTPARSAVTTSAPTPSVGGVCTAAMARMASKWHVSA
jgi:hypothetical protein